MIKDDISYKKLWSKRFGQLKYLANIANDPGVELNPSLSWEVNVLASHQIMEKLITHQLIKLFISSGSVYTVLKKKKMLLKN